MNKKIIISSLLVLGLLTGCTNQTKDKINKDKSVEMKTHQVSSKESSSEKKQKNDAKLTIEKTNNFLKNEVKPSFLPQELPLIKSGFLNLYGRSNEKIKEYSLNFSDQQKKPDNNLTEENLIIKYQEKLSNPTEIKNQINWIAPESGLPQIDLGYNITATTQGAAGSTYLNWNEGKWSITIKSSNQISNSNTKAQELARQLVEYFETNALPAPTSIGSVKINQESTDNQKIQIKFDHNQALIYLNGPDIFTVLNVATNLR